MEKCLHELTRAGIMLRILQSEGIFKFHMTAGINLTVYTQIEIIEIVGLNECIGNGNDQEKLIFAAHIGGINALRQIKIPSVAVDFEAV